MRGTVSLREVYRKYDDKVKFIKIYIREAHPVDGWWLGKGLGKHILNMFLKSSAKVSNQDIYDPQTIEERRKVAGDCEDSLKYGVRTYVDEMDDAVNIAYAGWPTRLYMVDEEGKVIYHGGLGPWGFHPDQLDEAIAEHLSAA